MFTSLPLTAAVRMAKRRSQPSRRQPQAAADLPDAEAEVLACLWHDGPSTAATIREHLQTFRPMAHGSVLTLLKRLTEKGLVGREKSGQGKAFLYHAKPSSEPTLTRIVKQISERLFGGNRVAVLASLLEISPPTPEELDEMRQLLDDMRSRERS